MSGPFVHRIDPVIGEIGGLYLWWYGLSYALGFLGLHLWFRRAAGRLKLSLLDVYDFSLYLIVGVLLGGRLVEVFFYEWSFYKNHLFYIPAYWLGGMSSHGLLLGAVLSTWIFCRRRKKSFLSMADELVIPGAWFMGTGRIGNFIDGQILGAPSNAWWAVRFPDAEGFRHPVVLYDGLKNLLLIPLFLLIRKWRPVPGVLMAHFLFWYASLRLFVDAFREYRVSFLHVGTGQIINLVMALTGLFLLCWFSYGRCAVGGDKRGVPTLEQSSPVGRASLWSRQIALALLLFFCLTMPSDWTQDIPARYGERHPGLEYSVLYPRISAAEFLDE